MELATLIILVTVGPLSAFSSQCNRKKPESPQQHPVSNMVWRTYYVFDGMYSKPVIYTASGIRSYYVLCTKIMWSSLFIEDHWSVFALDNKYQYLALTARKFQLVLYHSIIEFLCATDVKQRLH